MAKRSFFQKPYRWASVYAAVLAAAFAYVLLDAFVIPRAQAPVVQQVSPVPEEEPAEASEPLPAEDIAVEAEPEVEPEVEVEPMPSEPVITANSYRDDNISIEIETVRRDDTTLYVADIVLSDSTFLKTALAQDTFGRNIKETTSQIAEEHGAIFAVNGDYYGFRDSGYVVRNGVLYRDTGSGQALVIDADGDFSVVQEGEMRAESLMESGAVQVLSFGPALVLGGEITVDEDSEVGKAKEENPRTAIGQVGELHYIVIVSDGRTEESSGLSLMELAEEFQSRGCTIAYNLDGGGSSSMVFNGELVNNPTSGRSIKEREVSDIVYIGYE
ncbi:MAG: phosphodiester glycosidase family protein [Oscillospiraceae bacterium]